MFDPNESMEITRKLLIALGIEIQKDTNVLINQNDKRTIVENGKFVKANIDPNKALYISDYDVKLDPLNPKCTKIMEKLFGEFLEYESSEDMENILSVPTFFFDIEKNEDAPNRYRLEIKFEDGKKWMGNYYLNKIICYDEAILVLDGTFADTDLRPYDVEQSEWDNE